MCALPVLGRPLPAGELYLAVRLTTADASSSVNERDAAGDAMPMSQLVVKVASR
jgi:hypothetical protein